MNAEQIVGQLRAKPSTDDVVVVWFSQAVTVDFIVAGAYPWLRPEYAAQTRDDGAHAHFLQPWQAAGVLGYVERRVTAGGRQLGNAMRALSRNIRAAIIEAAERPELIAAPLPHLVRELPHAEEWQGTPRQFAAAGFQVRGPWPSEPGAPTVAHGKDRAGRRVTVTQHCPLWGLYQVRVQRDGRGPVGLQWRAPDPEQAHRRQAQAVQEARAELAALDTGFQQQLARLGIHRHT